MCNNLETLSQLTPIGLNSMRENPLEKIMSADLPPQPRTHEDVTPAKNSSSKRVKLIKQEKK